ncbi:MAG: DUF2157 domain-containing protein [Candidatus Paceibacterota bacterium]|jgi:hypothetical protein
MATKEEVLQYIKTLAEQKIITKEDIDTAYEAGSGVKTNIVLNKKLSIANILYYIGGGIVFLGISILIYQNWSTFNFVTKVLATLGSGIVAYFIGLLFSRDERTETASPAFYLIFALVAPIGLYVVFDNAGFDVGSYGLQSLISGIVFSACLLSYIILRKNIFALFSIIFGTWLFFSLTSFIVNDSPYLNDSDFYQYRIFLTGLSYILLGYEFSKSERAPLSGFLYGFGILGFLGAALSLGGWKPEQNIFWELIFPVLVFGTLFLSVSIKSKAFLTWGTLFLMAYILKITSEYFSSGLGWPLALVIAGLSMIGVGYMSISIKNKYLSSPS